MNDVGDKVDTEGVDDWYMLKRYTVSDAAKAVGVCRQAIHKAKKTAIRRSAANRKAKNRKGFVEFEVKGFKIWYSKQDKGYRLSTNCT